MEKNNKSHEVDFISFVIRVLKEWKSLALFIAVFSVLGLIVAFNNPKKYTADVILVPEYTSGGSNISDNLTSIASSFDISLGSKSSRDAIYPAIYPDIFSSTDFLCSLFEVKVRLKDDNNERTYIEHLRNDLKVPFWRYPKKLLMIIIQSLRSESNDIQKEYSNDPFLIPKKDYDACRIMSKQIDCFYDKKTREITISVTDQDPMVAAIMADTLQHRLQTYITDYRTKKARVDYDYYDKLLKEAEEKYNFQKKQYTDFSDSHRNSVLTSVTTQQSTLKTKMANAYDHYAAISKMREQAMARIQERTPAFTIIQSAKMPYKTTSTPKIIILFIYVIAGCVFDVLWVIFGKHFFSTKRKTSISDRHN